MTVLTLFRRAPLRRGYLHAIPAPHSLGPLPFRRAASSAALHDTPLTENTRNIGIIAHVDAGKTTTTERMLYYSGVTQRVGDVDSGNTVTDFLELERERGITIQSAAITFTWPLQENCAPGTGPKTVNLIDTPGHQDFRFEVDRCLPILDGAVCIIDSVKGVEAHTERVWSSAHELRIPRLVYCNKLDREGASFKKAVLEIGARLGGWPLVCQIPWWEKENFVGVIDVIDRVGYRWKSERQKTRYGPSELKEKLQSSNQALLAEIEVARQRLVEGLADYDEAVMDEFLAENQDIPASLIKQGIRKAIKFGDARIIPVFAGSSMRHIGVEPLMDAITDYLPNPSERPDVEVRIGGSRHQLHQLLQGKDKKGAHNKHNIASVASVFKVFDHPKEGVTSFVRVYHGTLGRNASNFNTNVLANERPMGILQISASKTHDVQELAVGQIGALRGLKKARTGDTLVTTANNKPVAEGFRHMQVRPPEIPPPVAFLQVDPYGLVARQQLEGALENASREDPSLRWSFDSKTEQFTIQGMGKLHLDISLHNLRQKYKIDADFGPIEVDYKECVTVPTVPQYASIERSVASKAGKAACTVVLQPVDDVQDESLQSSIERDGNFYHIEIPLPEDPDSLAFDLDEARHQLLNGAIAGLARGPRRASPVNKCHVAVTLDTAEGAIQTPTGGHFSTAARTAVQAALRDAFDKHQIGILEPIMLTHITCPETVASTVQHDITAGAGGHILEVNDQSAESSTGEEVIDVSKIYTPPDPYDSVTSLRGRNSTARTVEIVAKVPYKEMLNYDDHLRSKTKGRHSMTMSFDSFAKVAGPRERGL